jgi:branched-subunit amino acid transport protein
VTWAAILVLAAGAYACKAVGLVALGGRRMPEAFGRVLVLVPAALLAAVAAVDTFSVPGPALALDARAVGVAAGGVAAWRRAPFPVVIALAAIATVIVRRVGGAG